ncbi:MAG: hypothetical protein IPH20_07390 [Bacteroidales bacterium]|nr:hypothetical protein [Bacteroidales bacterium]
MEQADAKTEISGKVNEIDTEKSMKAMSERLFPGLHLPVKLFLTMSF